MELREPPDRFSALNPGASLADGRFEVRQLLGRGGMGMVYEAYDSARGEPVALKTLKQLDAEELYRFKKEFRSLADLEHPNLIGLHELFSDEGRWFFTMELLAGEDFLSFVRDTPLSPATPRHPASVTADTEPRTGGDADTLVAQPRQSTIPASPLPPESEVRLRAALLQLTHVLQALHLSGKVHRDIKPSNVMVTEQGRVVLLDFGLVSDLSVERTSPSDLMLGTPAYMSPEQATGEETGAATDWYAVGVMLYEALAGRLPFTGNAVVMLVRKQSKTPPVPRELATDAPADLSDLAMRLLDPDPATRAGADDIYRTLGQAPELAALQPRAQTGVAPLFVGREAELAALREAFRATERGLPVVALVAGPSGVGKSALVDRFLDELPRYVVVLTGRCYQQESVPHKTCDSLIDATSRYLQRLPPTRAAAMMPRNVHALTRIFPVLNRLEAVQQTRLRSPLPDDPLEVRRRAFDALKELLARIAEQEPLVLYIDDLQWSDVDGSRLLASLLLPPDAPQLLLIGAYRSEHSEDSLGLRSLLKSLVDFGEVDHRQITLDRLSDAEAVEMARGLLPEDAHASLGDALAAGSGGNPLFIEALVRFAAFEGIQSSSQLSLEELLVHRIDTQPEAARALLRVCCLSYRQPTPLPVALRAAGQSSAERGPLDQLVTHELVQYVGGGATQGLRPFHERVRELVTGRLTPAERKALHAALVEAFSEEAPEDVEARAAHLEGAGDGERAAAALVEAGDAAAAKLAFHHAADLYRRALAIGHFEHPARGRLQRALGDALRDAGHLSEAGDVYLRAAAQASRVESQLLRRSAAEQLLKCGRLEDGRKVLRGLLRDLGMKLPGSARTAILRALAIRARRKVLERKYRLSGNVESEETARLRLDLCAAASQVLLYTDFALGFWFQEQAFSMALRQGRAGQLAEALAFEALARARSPTPKRRALARRLFAEAEQLSELGDARARARVKYQAGQLAMLDLNYANALKACDEAAELYRQQCIGASFEITLCECSALYLLWHLGELKELCSRAPRLLSRAQALGDLFCETWVCALAFPWLVRDDLETARHNQQVAAERRRSDRFMVVDLQLMMGQGTIDLYAADLEEGYQRYLRRWARFERSIINNIPQFLVPTLFQLGELALATSAARGGDEELLARAHRCARQLSKVASSLAIPTAEAYALAIRAGLSHQRDNDELAIKLLRQAESAFERAGAAAHACTQRLRRGELLGGDEGAALAEQALTDLADRGAVAPRKLARISAAGFRRYAC